MPGSMLVLRWKGSDYDSIDGMLEQMAHEITAMGYRVVQFVAAERDWRDRLYALLQAGDIVFALGMSGVASDLVLNDRGLLWDVMKVPLFNWNCDHPAYFPNRHAIRSRFLLHGYVFPEHAQYNLRHLNPNGMAFNVHMGMPRRSLFDGAPLPLAGRNGRIIFSKSGKDTNAIEADWRDRMPLIQQLLFDAAEELFHRSTADFVPVLQRLGERQGLLLDGSNELTLELIRQLDAYIRYRRGNLVIQSVLDQPVDVFGSGWDHIDWDGARAVFHGALEWRDVVRQLPFYIGCLSTNPLIDQSVHDRVFFALAAGVAPVSDDNAFSRAHLPGLDRYCFDFTSERIAGAVDALLSDPTEAVARAEAAWQALTPDFTMRRAAEQILQFLVLHGANAQCTA